MSDIKGKNEDKEVLINTVFTGDYTNKNIGHEIINMYKTNKNENYIYISPWGTVAKENYNKIKEVIFVRAAGKNKLEIIGKASGLKYWGNEKINEKFKEKWNGCLPIHFDITFNFVPRMCNISNCDICPLNPKETDWENKICHKKEGQYCSLALYSTGIKHKCEGAKKCPLIR